MKYSRVHGHDHLLRDESTKSIINTNVSEYENYIKMKQIKESEVGRIKKIEDDLTSLKGDIDEIKFLLRKLSND
jgi:hypothetical protein